MVEHADKKNWVVFWNTWRPKGIQCDLWLDRLPQWAENDNLCVIWINYLTLFLQNIQMGWEAEYNKG